MDTDPAKTDAAAPPLEIEIYQLPGDDMFRGHRIDGTGWDWSWAPWQRDWMDATPAKYAYRCLPLTIANQTGLWVYNPVGFTAYWNGHTRPGGVSMLFDNDPALWGGWINNQFGEGVITWNTPFLFRTKPAGSRLLVGGPVNSFKHGVQPLTAIIESDWMSMSFTMNWKMTMPGTTVRFDVGEPLFQVMVLSANVCHDMEEAAVTYDRLENNPDLAREYQEWREGRTKFHQLKAAAEVPQDSWQKDYFRGEKAVAKDEGGRHMTKVKPPNIRYKSARP